VDNGLVCGNGKPPKYTEAEYAALKKKAIETSPQAAKKFQDKEDIQRNFAAKKEIIELCKSGKCEFQEKIGENLCIGGPKILFENGKGCSMGEPVKTLPAGQKPDPIPSGGQKGIQDSLGKNCKSGKCHWNEKIGQAICGDGDGNKPAASTKTPSSSSVNKGSYSFIASAMSLTFNLAK
jgi:hypothetical protein